MRRILSIIVLLTIFGGIYFLIPSSDIEFSKDADINDSVNKEELALVDSLSDRGIKTKYDVRYISVHCTASSDGKYITRKELDKIFKARGWDRWGYTVVINPDGSEVWWKDSTKYKPNYITSDLMTYGVAGFNSHMISVAWCGGYNGTDSRRPAQKAKLLQVIYKFKQLYPKAVVKAHYQFPNVKKTCCNYDSMKEWSNYEKHLNEKY